MRNDYSERSERLVGYWWLSLIAGVILIAIGFFVIVHPAASYLSFAVWFGVAVMFSGILTLVQSLSSNNRYVRNGWLILASIADIIIGIILVFNAVVSAFVMPILLGAWLLYRGTAMLMQGIDLKSHSVRGSGWLIFYSAIVIVVGLAVLWMPATLGVEAVILFVAIAFVSYGVSMVTLAFRLLDVHRYAKRLGAEE
jgi:uncharacterized membrane protein HdeD (DUF308 family)